MASTFDDTVLDFDLNLLQQPSTVVNDCKYDKQRKAILIAKKKTIATDSLIRKYYAKNEKLEQTEVLLLAAKEECKQVCLDYKETLEKCTRVEKEALVLKSRNKELEESNILLQNQCEAIKSHANQLQVLVNEHETTIDGLKIEKQLNKTSSKDYETKLTDLKNDNETLLKHICLVRDIVFGKRKLKKHYKLLLKKYEKFKYKSDGEDSTEESNDELFDSLPPSPMSVNDSENKTEVAFNVNRNSNLRKKVIEDHESDYSNEVVSEDTGRGSSLAFSDGEKCFNSPDYFRNDSPLATDVVKSKDKRTFADIGTNTVHKEYLHVATSPIIFKEHITVKTDKGVQVEIDARKLHIISDVIIKEKNKVIDRATSPILDVLSAQSESNARNLDIISDAIIKEENKLVDRATSPIPIVNTESTSAVICKDDKNLSHNVNTLPPVIDVQPEKYPLVCEKNEHSYKYDVSTTVPKNVISIFDQDSADVKKICLSETLRENSVNTSQLTQVNVEDLSSQCEIEISGKSSSIEEKICLERNNSNNVCNESVNDNEIEMILNTMRLTERLITPIPKTPVKLSRIKSKKIISPVPETSEPHTACVEALKLKEENKTLKTSISDLSEEIMKIKRILKDKMLMPESPKKRTVDKSITSDLMEDSSQDTLVVNVNDDISNAEEPSEDLPLSEYRWNESSPTKGSSILQNVTDVTVSPKKNTSSDNINMLIEDTRESRMEYDGHNRINSHKDHTDNDTQNNNYFSDTEITDERRKKRKVNSSKLEKFRKKLLPKGKIAKVKAPVKKPHAKPKSIERFLNVKNLNNKSAYEKAVNVMKELKLKKMSKENNVSKSKKENEYGPEKNNHKEAVALNEDKPVECSPNKEVSAKIPHNLPNGDDLVKNASCSPDKEHSVEIAQLLPNVNQSFQMKQCSPSKAISPIINDSPEITQCSPNKDKNMLNTNDSPSRQISIRSPQKLSNHEDLFKMDQSLPKKELPHKITQYSPRKGDLTKITQDSPTKEDSVKNVKQAVVCLSHLKVDEIINKTVVHESNSETVQDVFKTANCPPQVKNYITTRSRSKMSDQESITSSRKSSTESMTKYDKDTEEVLGQIERAPSRKRLRGTDSDGSPETSCKRVLRSSNMSPNKIFLKQTSTEIESSPISCPQKDISKIFAKSNEPFSQYDISKELNDSCFDDILPTKDTQNHPKQSILCKMIDKYGKANVRFNAKKVPDNISNSICKKLEDNIAHIVELPAEKAKLAMSKLVEDIQHNWNLKHFLSGFLKYLKDPARKVELFNKAASPPAPAMTKSEQVVLYIVKQLDTSTPDIVNIILTQIEFSLFQLNKTPEFDVIESLSHVYALICRYFGLKMRLRLFILDAMYCLSFKVVPLIKQCLDVWMHILPLAHMGIAKSPLVTCLVYLLHFYKCEDRFNRVQDIRMILNRKYFYQITDWNEPKILELFRTSIIELRDVSVEKKMLRMALIILAKRQGPEWCQKNIIKKMLMPLIEKDNIPLQVKQFSIEMLGPLLKPYPVDMKVHCEIVVNNLLDMLDLNPQDSLKEAIFTSLIYMSKHNQNRVLQALLLWKPKQITPEFEQLLKDYVQEKSLKVWKGLLSRITF